MLFKTFCFETQNPNFIFVLYQANSFEDTENEFKKAAEKMFGDRAGLALIIGRLPSTYQMSVSKLVRKGCTLCLQARFKEVKEKGR